MKGVEHILLVYPETPVQEENFECGDLCMARVIDILLSDENNTLKANHLSNIWYSDPIVLRNHTKKLLLDKHSKITPYPKTLADCGESIKSFTTIIEIICLCKMPFFSSDAIVECKICKKKCHKACILNGICCK